MYMNMTSKTELTVPDTRRHPTRSRSVSPAPRQLSISPLTVFQRKRMYEQDRGSGRGGQGEKDMLLPPSGQDHTDSTSEKTSGKRRHSTKDKFSTRGSSFRAKKLRQEVSTGDLGNVPHLSPQFRHKQQPSLSSIVPPPLWNRLRSFGHHDLQSATMEKYGSAFKGADSERGMRKKPTGASAAHVGIAPLEGDLETMENDLVALCPAFRNEVGGDSDWAGVSMENKDNQLLTLRGSLSHDKQKRVGSRAKMLLEGTIPSKEIMEHKSPMDRQVLQILQPQSSVQFPFEFIDYGALYYRNHFYQQDHQNFFGIDENNGPIAVSLRREKVSDDLANYFDTPSTLVGQQAPLPKHQYRVIVRTSELETLRGTILEDSIPSGTKTGTSRGLPPRDVIDYISQGEFHVGCLKVGKPEKKVWQELMRLDEQELNNKYKVGILYCKKGQTSEEDMYNNEKGSEAFEAFLQAIGTKVTMKGFTKYRAQLDNKTDTTGSHSIHTEHQGTEIMFHISTYLPHTPSNSQQLLRKRHIGNDIVTVIFQEPGCTPFSPKVIRSQFQHIFVIVRVENAGTDYTKYRVAVTRSQDIPYFGPPIPEGAVFDKNEQFKEFFLTKLINACNASLRSEKFSTMATRTRRQYLSDLCENSTTNLTIEQANNSGLVAGLLSKNWGGKKREKPHLHGPLVYTPGALVWNVAITLKEGKPHPFSEEHDTALDSILILAADLMVFVYTNTRENLLHIPMRDIAGWVHDGKRINLFYDGSHCLSLEVYEQEDVRDITCRLQSLGSCVTASHEATLMEFQRGGSGFLGFVINEVGEVDKVGGQASHIGLQIGSRILQVEDRLVCTHKHSQITETLTNRKKSTVKAYVIPPAPTSFRALMYYPSVNWPAIWASRPSHMNGETEDQTQNGTEPMDSLELGSGSVALRRHKKAATISHPNRLSYHEAIRIEELAHYDEQPMDDDEPIYDRLRTSENQSSQANFYQKQPRSPKSSQRGRHDDNTGFTRVRGRQGARDHMHAQQITENIRAEERARSAGPSPEPMEHRLDIYTSHVPTHISTSSFLPHSQPHTSAPLSSLRRKSDLVMVEIFSPKSPGACPPTPGSVQELAKKFSFNSPPQSNKSSPSRNPGSVGGAKSQTIPMKATMATSEMTRSNIPLPTRLNPQPSGGRSDVQLRGRRSPKIRPASWDASLIYNSEREAVAVKETSKEEGEGGKEGQFSRKENGRLPIRKKVSPREERKGGGGGGGKEQQMNDEEFAGGEEIVCSATGEQLSQEELRKTSVRERTQRWEARGSELPSFFTLPRSHRMKGHSGSVSPSPVSPQSKSGSRIPVPRSATTSTHTHSSLTQSQKVAAALSSLSSRYSKQGTPPIQEESESQTDGAGDSTERERSVSQERILERGHESGDRDEAAQLTSSGEVKLGSFVGGRVGVVAQMRGGVKGSNNSRPPGSNSQVTGQRERPLSPTRALSPQRRTISVHTSRSPSPGPSGSKIPTSLSKRKTSPPPNASTSNRGPGQNSSRTPKESTLDTVVLESSLNTLHISDSARLMTKESTNKKVEDWLRQSTTSVTEDTALPGKHESMRKPPHSSRSLVKTAMI